MDTCQTSLKDRYNINAVLWYSPSSVPNILEITTVGPQRTNLSGEGHADNDLPTCTVDRPLKPSCILLVRIFQ